MVCVCMACVCVCKCGGDRGFSARVWFEGSLARCMVMMASFDLGLVEGVVVRSLFCFLLWVAVWVAVLLSRLQASLLLVVLRVSVFLHLLLQCCRCLWA